LKLKGYLDNLLEFGSQTWAIVFVKKNNFACANSGDPEEDGLWVYDWEQPRE
jgi:hypothetical protein